MTKKILQVLMVTTLLIGCKKQESIPINTNTTEFKNETMSYIFDFPDTVTVNKQYNGTIIYKNILDTITTHLATPKDSLRDRYITYTMTISDNLQNENVLKKMVKDTFGAVDYRTIPLFKLKFQKSGTYFIDGFINDEGYLKLAKKDSIRVITNTFRIWHKVIVKE